MTALLARITPQTLLTGLLLGVALLAAAVPTRAQTDGDAPSANFSPDLPDSLRALSTDQLEEQLAARAKEPPLRLALGERLIGEGRLEDAITQYRQYVLLNPDYEPALRRLAQLYDWTGQSDRAAAMYERLVEVAPDDVMLRRTLAQRYAWTDRPRQAAEQLRQFLDARPGYLDARRELAQLYAWTGQTERAIEQYRSVVRRDPSDYASKRQLAQQLVAAERSTEAVAIYRNLADVWPDSIDTRVQLAQTLAWNDRRPAAMRELDRILERAPDHDGAQMLAAELQRWDGDNWYASRERLRRVRTRDPDNERANELLRGLRYEYGPRARAAYEWRSDSNGLTTEYLPLAFGSQVGPYWRLGATAFRRRVFDDRLDEDDEDAIFSTRYDPSLFNEAITGYGGAFFAERAFGERTTVRAQLGLTHYVEADESVPTGELSLEQAFSEAVVLTTTYRYDLSREGVVPLSEGISTHALTASLFLRPAERVELGLQVQPTYYTDSNARLSLYAGGNYLLRLANPELRLLAAFGYDDALEFYPLSLPYFTPSQLSTYSTGLQLRQTFFDWLVVGGSYRLVLQQNLLPDTPVFDEEGEPLVIDDDFEDLNLANNFGVYLGVDRLDFHQAYVRFSQTGSAVYSANEVEIGYAYRF